MSAHLQLSPAFGFALSPAHLHGFKHAQGDDITVWMFLEDIDDDAVASFLKKDAPIVPWATNNAPNIILSIRLIFFTFTVI